MKYIVTFLLLALLISSAFAGQSVSEPKSLQLTVYNGNFALVRDLRCISLIKGLNSISLEDVAAQIDPTSILFRSLTAPNSVGILEQNYQYDLINPDNILNKSVGQKVTFTVVDQSGNVSTQTGVLLAPPSNGGVVIKADSGKIILQPQGQVSVEKMPDGLHPKPTLNWLLNSSVEGNQSAEVSYITNGINWKADYVALVNKDDSSLDLNGWVTLDNQSGATYNNAKLTLMAGDVRRNSNLGRVMPCAPADAMMEEVKAAPQFQEQSFFEYHMYTMDRPTTIADKETKQLSLLNASNVPVTKQYIYDGRSEWWRNWWYPGRTGDPGAGYDTSNYHKVNVVLQIKNSEQNHMGMPLPKGNIRVYKLDNNGNQQFVGEDTIDHTPKDELIRLYIGDAFDVVGDYKRTNYKSYGQSFEESFEVRIRNHKTVPVEVNVTDHVWGDWKVTSSSHAYNKVDAHTIAFPVKVNPDGETVVTYTIRTQ